MFVTHDMGEAIALADRIGVMDGGRLIWSGRAEDIVAAAEPRVRRLLEAAVPASRTPRVDHA